MKKLLSTRSSETVFSLGILILRLGAGLLMAFNHGLDKLSHFSQKSAQFADPFNIGSVPSFTLVIFAEFFCALFIVLGLFTRFACIPLVISLSVAFFIAHKGNFSEGRLAALFLSCFLTLLFTGPGKFSLDRFIAK